MPLPLRQNAAWATAGTVVYNLCQWGALVALARFASPTEVGRFALGLAITAPIMLFAGLQLGEVEATDARDEYSFPDYLTLRITTTAAALIAVAAIVVALRLALPTAIVTLVLGTTKAFDALSEVMFGLFQKHERLDYIAQGLIVNGCLSLVLVAAASAVTHGAVWAAIGTCLGSLLTLVVFNARRAVRRLRAVRRPDGVARRWGGELMPRWHRQAMRRLTWLCLPLGVVTLLNSLNANVPRYFVQHYLGERELGIFAAIAYIVVAGGSVVAALGQAASPRLAAHFWGGQLDDFRRLTGRLIAFASLFATVGILLAWRLGSVFLDVVYGREYARELTTFRVMVVATAIGFIPALLNYPIIAARRLAVMAGLYVVVVVTTAASGLILVPRHGVVGAALATGAGLIVQAVGCTAIVLHCLRAGPGVPPDRRSQVAVGSPVRIND